MRKSELRTPPEQIEVAPRASTIEDAVAVLEL
jgi:hypothetical protein